MLVSHSCTVGANRGLILTVTAAGEPIVECYNGVHRALRSYHERLRPRSNADAWRSLGYGLRSTWSNCLADCGARGHREKHPGSRDGGRARSASSARGRIGRGEERRGIVSLLGGERLHFGAESAVEPTRSENITVTWRRSAVSFGAASGAAADAGRSVTAGAGAAVSSLNARIIFRRCPIETPRRSKSVSVSSLRTPKSMSFSVKRWAYSDMPSFWSQSAICCIAVTLRI
jgi:hypothetical protein